MHLVYRYMHNALKKCYCTNETVIIILQLCAEAATRVSELRSCLESSLIRCASLETERAILKSCVDNSSSKIEALKDALETERHEVAILKEEWQRVHAEDDSSQATSAVESELIVAKLRVEELDTQLRKATFDLAGARSNEALLRKALETSVEYGQESAKTASALQGMVSIIYLFLYLTQK